MSHSEFHLLLVRRALLPVVRQIDVWVGASGTCHSQLSRCGAPDPRLVVSTACSFDHFKEHPFMYDPHELLIAVLINHKRSGGYTDKKKNAYLDRPKSCVVGELIQGLIKVKSGDFALEVHHRK